MEFELQSRRRKPLAQELEEFLLAEAQLRQRGSRVEVNHDGTAAQVGDVQVAGQRASSPVANKGLDRFEMMSASQ